MFNKKTTIKNLAIVSSFLLLIACGKEEKLLYKTKENSQVTPAEMANKTDVSQAKDEASVELKAEDKAEEITWDELVPADYNPEEAIGKYIEQLENLKDEDQEAMEIYGKIQAELDNAPVNMAIDGKNIKMPGFIAPLDNNNGIIDEFLLVPYFGACIHSPPPPMNQTVMVKADKGTGVKSEESSFPVWITGKLVAVEERTDIGAAGYRIENPKIEPYEEE